MDETRDAALEARAWPFEEARRLVRRYEKAPPVKGHVLFETGYGPSGLPHIGTFGEVARTTMVRRAFETMSDIPTRLICFSDDMDGLRKVPGNVPMQDELRADLNLPLTRVRDPFGTHASFGAHNNARLRSFLDAFGFDYEFASATEYYREGRFDAILLAMAGLTRLGRQDEVTEALDPRAFVPAPGQGAIALECRDGDASVRAAVAPLDHPQTARAVAAERAFLAALGGGCNVPLGAHAFAAGHDLELVGFVAAADGSAFLRGEVRGGEPSETGRRLAAQLVDKGATALLAGAAGA